ncbi:MAG: zinc transporter ZntB [Kofleriaceae bacterium]
MPVLRSTSGLVHAVLLDGRGGGELLDWPGLARWRPTDGLVWVDLDYRAPDAERWLGLEANLAPPTRQALVADDPRPRAEVRGDGLLLISRGINVNAGAEPEDMVSMRAWIEPGRIITLRHRRVTALHTLGEQIAAGAGPSAPGEFVAALIDEILAPVSTLVDEIDDQVALLEDAVLGHHVDGPRGKIADLRRRAIAVRRFIGPQREALARLATAAVPWLTEADRVRLRDAAERQTRTVEELDAARDRAAVTHEELAARTDELANRRLYVLSLVTAVFLPLSFITGLLGVNVGGVPAQGTPWAFWVLCGLLGATTLGQLWLLRRLRWL